MQTGDTYNRGGLVAFLFSMIFSLAFFVYIALMHPGVDLKEVPEEANTSVSQKPDGADKSTDISQIDQPWVPHEKVVAYGAGIFKANCAVCHGEKGLGDGPAGQSLVPKPRNFVEGQWKQGGDSISLYKTIASGISGSSMASFKHLPSKDRWALIQFIRSITHNKIADKPAQLEAFAKSAE